MSVRKDRHFVRARTNLLAGLQFSNISVPLCKYACTLLGLLCVFHTQQPLALQLPGLRPGGTSVVLRIYDSRQSQGPTQSFTTILPAYVPGGSSDCSVFQSTYQQIRISQNVQQMVGAKKLTLPCTGHRTAAGNYVLRRIRAGQTPRPHVQWPRPGDGHVEEVSSDSD